MTDTEPSRLAEWADLVGASLPGDVRDRSEESDPDTGGEPRRE